MDQNNKKFQYQKEPDTISLDDLALDFDDNLPPGVPSDFLDPINCAQITTGKGDHFKTTGEVSDSKMFFGNLPKGAAAQGEPFSGKLAFLFLLFLICGLGVVLIFKYKDLLWLAQRLLQG